MAVSFAKLAPTAVVVTVVGYCIWPYVFPGTPSEAAKPAKLPEIAKTMLTPKILPPSERDPFQTAAESRAPAKQVAEKPAVWEIAKNVLANTAGAGKERLAPPLVPGAPPGTPGTSAGAKLAPPAGSAVINKTSSAVATLTGTKTTRPAGLPPAFALQATCLIGDKGLAVINGQVCRSGEKLPSSGKTGPEVVLAQVFADKVLLETDGRTIEVKYSNTPNPATQGKSAAAPAGSKAASAAARTRKPATRSSPAAHGGSSKSAK